MKTHTILRVVLCAALISFGQAQAQDSATFDSQQNAWRLFYQDPETQQWVNKSYVARTAIKPTIKTTVSASGNQFTYEYTIRNDRSAKQNISVIQVWGIPLVYTVPNLPLITANAKTDPETEDKQQWAQLEAKNNFEKSVVKAPKGWSAGLRVDKEVGKTSFVWTPGLKVTDSYGIEPGHSQNGFVVVRAELPGVARTYLQGRIAEPWGLDGVPDTPYWRAKVEEIENLDYLLVPVLAPVIPLPIPYSGAALARAMRSHIQTWLKYGHVNADVLNRLNRQFDVLIPALEMGNKQGTRTAISAIRKECQDQNPNLGDDKASEDDDDKATSAQPRTPAQRSAVPFVALDRVAARALLYTLNYLTKRLESGR